MEKVKVFTAVLNEVGTESQPRLDIPRIRFVGDENDPRIEGLTVFARGICAIAFVASRIINTPDSSEDRYNPKSTDTMVEIINLMKHLGLIIRLQGAYTEGEIKEQDILQTQEYINGISDDRDEKNEVHLLLGPQEVEKAGKILRKKLGDSINGILQEEAQAEEVVVHIDELDFQVLANIYGIICHDLNNPLATLRGFQQLLWRFKSSQSTKGQEGSTEKEKNYVSKIRDVWGRVFDRAMQMVDLIQNPYLQIEAESHVWTKAVKALIHSYPQVVMVGLDSSYIGKRKVIWSCDWLTSFVHNCLQNSSRADATCIEVFAGERDSGFGVEIRDNGNGFPEEIIENGFNGLHGYASAQSNEVSTGTAMRVLTQMAQKYGGRIIMGNWSENGKDGAFIRLELPFAKDETVADFGVK